ncbi:F0F1 ATP synthase subunit B family protein [Arenibaculum pallidiluteum]|uniref:F0F1 ATP synthase subunit B family protein n=1 Tax=Arenibaculum pallidiluteum TaxID=2812559 RepID=UPI001A97650D|nr:F0F1 ATP synthase subunit B [Arenibaculum pallidiluteum]
MFFVPEFWVAVAFVVFVVLVFRKAKTIILSTLDERAEKIRRELEEAQRLREEAQALLAQSQRKQREALKEAEDIVAHARDEAERLRRTAETEMEEHIRRREAQAVDKIAQAEASALQQVRDMTVDIAIDATRRILTERMDERQSSALVEESIRELPKNLH